MMSDHSMPSTPPPPGWYAPSPRSARLRWWDGAAWTDHYRSDGAAEAAPPPAPDAAADPPTAPSAPPATRSARRVAAAQQTPAREAAPVPAAPAASTDSTAERMPGAPASARETPLSIAPPSVGPGYAPGEAFPDQILTRAPQSEGERIPRPLAYQPVSSTYAGDDTARFLAPSSRNGAAKTSLALVALSLVGWFLLFWGVLTSTPEIAGLVMMLSIALAVAALLSAVAGMVVAIQRPTRKREAVIGLAVSGTILVALAAIVIVQVVLSLI